MDEVDKSTDRKISVLLIQAEALAAQLAQEQACYLSSRILCICVFTKQIA